MSAGSSTGDATPGPGRGPSDHGLPTTEHDRPSRPYLRREAASRYLLEVWGISNATATLAKLAVVGGGPEFHKAGRWPLYPPDRLDDYARKLLGKLRASTSGGEA